MLNINKKRKSKLQALEVDAMGKSCSVSRLEGILNGIIKVKSNMEEDVVDRIEKQEFWYEHSKRMAEIKYMELTTERRK